MTKNGFYAVSYAVLTVSMTESYIKVILAIFDVLLQVHKIHIITIVETNKGIFFKHSPVSCFHFNILS